jgi:hypothetical protein
MIFVVYFMALSVSENVQCSVVGINWKECKWK